MQDTGPPGTSLVTPEIDDKSGSNIFYMFTEDFYFK